MKHVFAALLVLAALIGCASHAPQFSSNEGAITGQLLNSDKDPFDLSLAGDEGGKSLKIELHNTTGMTAVTFPRKDKSRFTFNHLPPGQYELSVYAVVPGKRSIAGSTPATVDVGRVTPVNITLAVTPAQN